MRRDARRSGMLSAIANQQLPITLDDVAAAAHRIAGVANRTPVLTGRSLDERLGATVYLKAESFQRGGAFKFRGGFWTTRSPRYQSRNSTEGSSRHRQATTRRRWPSPPGLPAPRRPSSCRRTRPRPSVRRPRATARGSSSSTATSTTARRSSPSWSRVRKTDARAPLRRPAHHGRSGNIHARAAGGCWPARPGGHPFGGGGQLSGGAVAAAGASVRPRVVGVEPAAVGQWRASLDAGRPTRVEVGRTIADGQQLPAPGNLTFAVVKELVEDVVSVTDDEVLSVMAYLFERQKIVVEPSGSSALAAVLSGRVDVRGLNRRRAVRRQYRH